MVSILGRSRVVLPSVDSAPCAGARRQTSPAGKGRGPGAGLSTRTAAWWVAGPGRQVRRAGGPTASPVEQASVGLDPGDQPVDAFGRRDLRPPAERPGGLPDV